MKTKLIFAISIISTLILGSCGTSNEVVGGGVFQKRKFNKGFYWNKNANIKESSAKNVEELDIFKREEETSKKYVSSTSLYSESTNEVNFVENQTNDALIDASSENSNTDELVIVVADISKSSENPSSSQLDTDKSGVIEKTKDYRNIAKKERNQNNKQGDEMFILAVICAILIPPLGVAIHTNIDWMKVLICLLLTFLFFLPGMIYALLVVFDVI